MGAYVVLDAENLPTLFFPEISVIEAESVIGRWMEIGKVMAIGGGPNPPAHSAALLVNFGGFRTLTISDEPPQGQALAVPGNAAYLLNDAE